MDKKEIKKIIRERLFLDYGKNLNLESIQQQELLQRIDYIYEYLEKERNVKLTQKERSGLSDELKDELFGWGPLEALMADKEVTEIMINGPFTVYIEKNGHKVLTDVMFDDEPHLRYTVDKMLTPTGRRVDESYPYVDFSLSDGSRVNVIIPPVSASGTVVTIRKFLASLDMIDDLVKLGTLDARMGDFLSACVRAKVNMIFSGATGCGKTTTLEVLSSCIGEEERIVTIEDALELHLRQKHVVRLLTRPHNIEGKGSVSIRDLFINTLRMRPMRIILGEIRGQESLDYLQALNSGHRGSLAVIHASSPEDVVTRLETMVFYSSVSLPLWAIRKQISQGLDLIVQQEQLVDGSRKITRISEVGELQDNSVIDIRDIFVYEKEGVDSSGKVKGVFKSTGIIPSFLPLFKQSGVSIDQKIFKE